MDPADEDRWRERIAERARTGSLWGELSFRRADGSTFPAEVTSGTFRDRSSAIRSCIIVRDITDRRRLEEELWELALVDELAVLLPHYYLSVRAAVRQQPPIIGSSRRSTALLTERGELGSESRGLGSRNLLRMSQVFGARCKPRRAGAEPR